jgi:hypothetical protein
MYKIGLPADGRALKASGPSLCWMGIRWQERITMKGYERETGGIFLGYHIYSKENHYTWIHLDLYRYGGFLK